MRSLLHIIGLGLLCTACMSSGGGSATDTTTDTTSTTTRDTTVSNDTASTNTSPDNSTANTTPNDSAASTTAVSTAPAAIQQEMLDVHAQTRAEVAVLPLIWSTTMENYAQEWADFLANQNNCRMEHRSNLGQNPLGAGENLFWASPLTTLINGIPNSVQVQAISATRVAQDWADEKAFYDYNSNSCAAGEQCGHYTQMVWRDTTEVGCAMAICPDSGQIWVCNYNPPGNFIGRQPY